MPEKIEGTNPLPESFEELKFQEKQAAEAYEELVKALKDDSRNPRLCDAVDSSFDSWQVIRNKLIEIESKKKE